MLSLSALAAGVGIATSGTLFSVSASGPGGVIPDNYPVSGQVFSSSVSVPTSAIIAGVSFTGLNHTWCGDLIMTLTGPGAGNSFTFFHRPGQTTATGVGQNGDFLAGNTYAFADGGMAWNTGSTIPSGNYAPVFSPFAPPQPINSFAGLSSPVAGTWTLTISDHAELDVGSLTNWSLVYKAPAPGVAALFGVAGVAGLRRRR